MSLILLLNPKQYGGTPITEKDTSDILDRYAKRRRKQLDTDLEEEIAAQMLQKRQQDFELPQNVNRAKLELALRDKMTSPAKPGELAGQDRRRRLQLLLLMLAVEDYD